MILHPMKAGEPEPAATDGLSPAAVAEPVASPASVRTLPRRLRGAYQSHVRSFEQPLLVAWGAFGLTFGAARGVTHFLRARYGGGGLVAGGRHLHHYNLGILLLVGVGSVALRGEDRHRRHPLTASAYGSGLALIVDELALLIDLEDVYWAKDGRDSVDAAIGIIAVGGLYLAAAPFWHRAVAELLRSRRP